MRALRRRWQSIDQKLPLVASGLVLLTAVVLATTSYVLIERALLDATGRRLHTSATLVAQMIPNPNAPSQRPDSASVRAEQVLRQFARGRASHEITLAALLRVQNPRDTTKIFGAFVDPVGRTALTYRRTRPYEPKWPFAAIERTEVGGDSITLGPIENLGGGPVVTAVRPLYDSTGRTPALLGYIVEARAIGGGRTSMTQFRAIVGDGVSMIIGQPGAGVWTDFDRIAPAPPVSLTGDSIAVFEGGVGAFAPIAGTRWLVWVSQPMHAVLAPARALLWSIMPIGLAIALVGAALVWRMTRRITHPIVDLTMAAENIAADNGASGLLPTVHLPSDADEVARLRYAFERMAQRVAERQTLELQLRHAQKMEAVGRLAGGVAHDFNNLLTAIRSYADLMLEDMPVWDSKRSDVLEIRAAAQRAAALTHQLLAFSRKQMLQPRVLDTGIVLKDVERMLKRLLIEDIRMVVTVPSGLWPVKADRGQLEQVIVNLAVNARDAMPHGGTLTISSANDVVLDPIETKHGVVPPAEYVVIRVTDTGQGMDAATQARMFEPFFTTKGVGQGTGLGLATVHGIVAQSGGYVTVDSDVGRGTAFAVYLPRVHDTPAERTSGGGTVQRGNDETILLVEDEQAVRALAHRVLVRSGFRVIESASPSHALRLAQQHAREIQLVLSDVVMPEMSGPALVAKIMEICPEARVLFISGYTDDEVIGRGLANPGMMLLQKPFSAQELVERVRSALDQKTQATEV